MSRSILAATLAVAMAAGLVARADDEFQFSGGDTGPTDNAAPSENYAGSDCIDGNCYGGGHHGHHGFGLHHGGRRGGYGAAYASWYPNGVENYGLANPQCGFRGPGGCKTCGIGDCSYRWYGQPDLFYNYYAWPQCSGVGAELYLSPRPVPPHVGHTFITYQPLMPHEFMYSHHRTYHRYYNGGQGLNRTCVKYYSPWFRK
jgi:hypothetical protein